MSSQLARLQGLNIYLIGMMGAGKSTVGQHLAKLLGYRFFDTDCVIEAVVQKSVAQIFAESGEDRFRALETQVLAELSAYTRLVIATGGGIILKRENWSYLRYGVIVWLDVPVERLQVRLQNDQTRPLLHAADLETTLRSLLQQRTPLYAQADVQVTCQSEETPDIICDRILQGIQTILKDPLPPPPFSQNQYDETNG